MILKIVIRTQAQLNKIDIPLHSRKSTTLEVPLNPLVYTDANKSESSILFGREFINNSQQTIRSVNNSSLFSKSHYGNFDPDNA